MVVGPLASAAVALLCAVAAAGGHAPRPGPGSPPAALVEARTLLEQGKLGEAEQKVRALLAEAPSADAHFLLGQILFRRTQARALLDGPGGAHSESTREGARASLLEYAKGGRYRALGASDLKTAALAQILLGDYAAADKLLTWSVAEEPKDAEAWYYLGRTKYNENRFEEAIAAFEECLRLEPRNVKAKDNLGLSYAGLGRADDAVAAHRAALEWQAGVLEPDPGPFLNLGSLLLERGQAEEAIPHLLRAAALSPAAARPRERLGKAYLEIDQIDRAVGELEAAVALDPDNAAVRFILGQAYRKKGWLEKAKAEFDRVAILNGRR